MEASLGYDRPLHIPSSAGDLPNLWAWRRLDDLCLGIFDCPHSTPALTLDGPLIARSQDIRSGVLRIGEAAHVSVETYQERISRAAPAHGDLLYSREGTYFGIAAEVPQDTKVCLGQRMVLLRPDPNALNFRYLRYWLNSPLLGSHLSGHRDGSVAERLNLPTIRAIPVLLPPLAEQRAIARILGALDDKIELNRRTNETLEATARALFQSWFVDFDPVRAKAEGRPPAGMDAATAALFPDAFEQSPLGLIPRGWRVRRLPELFDINPPRTLRIGEVAPYLEMANMPTSSARALDWEERAFASGMRFENGDVLVARITPCLENGKTAYVDFLAYEHVGWGSTEYIVLRSKAPIHTMYAYFLARSSGFRSHAISNMTGTSGRQRVPVECFSTYLLVEPPMPIIRRFGSFADDAITIMKSNDEQSRTLAATRDALLPKLLSGEVRVAEAEAEAKADMLKLEALS